jgi:hypothetical protein
MGSLPPDAGSELGIAAELAIDGAEDPLGEEDSGSPGVGDFGEDACFDERPPVE